MATWPEVRQYIFANYKVAQDDNDTIHLIFNTTPGRSQRVILAYIGGSAIWITSPISPASQVDANRLMQLTDGCGLMGVKEVAGMYVTHAVLPLADLSIQELETPMQWAYEEADQYEQALGLGDRF